MKTKKFLCCKYIRCSCSLFILSVLGSISLVHSDTSEVVTTQGPNLSDVDPETFRLETARLQSHLRGMFVTREKVPPYTTTPDGRVQVPVDLAVAVVSLLSMQDVDKTLSSNVLIKLYWTDPALRWNSSQYGGVRSVSMYAGSVWTPDVYIFNSVDKNVLLTDTDVVTITSDGQVSAPMDLIVRTFCNTSLDKYPFDSQTCVMTFHSKNYWQFTRISVRALYIIANASSLFTYSSEWVLKNKRIVTITGALSSEPMYGVSLEISRKTLFYLLCLVTPMVLTSFMNTLVFLLPLQSGEKISFLVTIFVSISVFISFFTDVMPRGLDRVPATLKLLIVVMLQSLVILVITLILMNREKAFGDTESGTKRSRDVLEDNSDPKSQNKTGIATTITTKLTSVMCKQPGDSNLKTNSADSEGVSALPATDKKNRCQNCCSQLTSKGLGRGLFALAFVSNIGFLWFLWNDTA